MHVDIAKYNDKLECDAYFYYTFNFAIAKRKIMKTCIKKTPIL